MAKLSITNSDLTKCVNKKPRNIKLKSKSNEVLKQNTEETSEGYTGEIQVEKDNGTNPDQNLILQTKDEKTTQNLIKKYNERRGRQIFVRFPKKLPAEENEFQQKAKALSDLVVRAHKPRQKHARFCLIDFNSKQDRDLALKSIRNEILKKNENFEGIFVSIPRTESEKFVQELVDKKLKSLEVKRSKMRLKREIKKALLSNVTSSIVVRNLPKSTSVADIRQLFPNAVDIHVKPNLRLNKTSGACVASITLPSVAEARTTVKQSLSLGGRELSIGFDTK